MRVLVVIDCWKPFVSGAVRTWSAVRAELRLEGHTVKVIHPRMFRSVGVPSYPGIRLSVMPARRFAQAVERFSPDAIHIASEGFIGMAARRYCVSRGLPFTTSYHTNLPAYVQQYCRMPQRITRRYELWFHRPAERILVPTATVAQRLAERGHRNLVVWPRGVDTRVFRPVRRHAFDFPRPIFLYVGRVSWEKRIDAFLELKLPGSKVLIGDGPARVRLARRFPDAHFLGYRFGEDLAACYAGADVLVFPSRTDTFGIVMLEANACGLPVAAFPVRGPVDVVQEGVTGCLNHDLRQACLDALALDRDACIRYANGNSWSQCAQVLLDNLTPLAAPSVQARLVAAS